MILVDLILVWASGWQTSSSIPDVLCSVAAVAFVATVLAVCTARGRTRIAQRAPVLVLLVVAMSGAWLAAEWVTGRLLGGQLLFHRHAPNIRYEFEPSPDVMPGLEGTAFYTTNSLGMRGAELPTDDCYKTLCIGGSTTANLFLDDEETWPRLIMDGAANSSELWVGDVGKSGYGSWHHVRFLDDASLLSQVDCLVVLVGINDFMRALQERPILAPPQTKPLYERSNIYRVLHNWHQVRKEKRRHREETRDGSYYVQRRKERLARAECDVLPPLDSSLEEYRTNLKTMIERCRSCDVRPVFMTQPMLWRVDLEDELDRLLWLGTLADGRRLSVPRLVEGMRMFNDALRETCRSEGVECVDLTSMDGDRRYFFDDCHFTEAGSRRVAELAAAQFVGQPRGR